MESQSAFPVSEEESRGKVAGVYGGMTLRDYFAAKALAAIIARGTHIDAKIVATERANRAYAYADAMLAARESKPE